LLKIIIYFRLEIKNTIQHFKRWCKKKTSGYKRRGCNKWYQ
jgi:hypothetical protein